MTTIYEYQADKHGPIVILPRVNLPLANLWMWATARNPPEYMWTGWKATLPTLRRRARGRAEVVRADVACAYGRTSDDDPSGAPNVAIRNETQRSLVYTPARHRRVGYEP